MMATCVYRETGEYQEFIDDVKTNIVDILDDSPPLRLSEVARRYQRRYDDRLVSAFKDDNGALYRQFRNTQKHGQQMEFNPQDVSISFLPPFYAQICEAIDRLEEDGDVERADEGTVPKARYVG